MNNKKFTYSNDDLKVLKKTIKYVNKLNWKGSKNKKKTKQNKNSIVKIKVA